ncbi:plasmid mobilization protein [Mucilaginibacter ginkgonis]|uniref:Plasmid mobilization relaxosome protein MobC n=1 Tax=Mucilaginibacter ginkgonis TaxID=2682091 RepID=A0A6I4I051_9SPHI|nr:plasmid mobilization relaxosome protein MobC [Mucilaginibacter ginkgonis]QQL49886.1 plasmid mobilization relaxosome protein MobC [Mucilaginibacter ginkgonis]
MEIEKRKIKWLNLRLTEDEFKTFKKHQQKSIFRKMSDYGRALLLNKPVTIYYRDKSADNAIEELAILRRELNAIGRNINQVTKQINTANGKPVPGSWIELIRMINKRLEPKMDEIQERMNKFSDLWSQKLNMDKASSGH